ncbi:uncharacterized protein LOC111791665 [Cucurbita pepo subsp. pepo]|uniref:uncharacterized protein LOC111791665 n=1 Tax=Cucurbita pepo subsp. pepo TaxID=3664 RepID=UPI000C9D4195|nr:uncharacterized protein LOC111791665 [Cucurbita pepo subsp. pepo]
MASSSVDQQHFQSQSKPTDPPPPLPPSAGNNPPPIYPPPTTLGYPPHAHGYPPAMGYPPAPHPGYPPAPGNYPPYNAYAYTQAPPAAYYNSNNNNNNPQYYRQETAGAGFLRGIFAALLLLVIIMTMSSIITWIILRPEIPNFKVDSFSLTNFNISKSNYSGIWDLKVTVQNPNHKLNLHFERIRSFVDYNENTVATSFSDPFFLDMEKSRQMLVKMTSSSPDDPGNWAQTEEKLERERATGTVSFTLRLLAWTTFRSGSGSGWTRRVILRVFCEDLKLVFTGHTTDGVYSPGAHSKTCKVLV